MVVTDCHSTPLVKRAWPATEKEKNIVGQTPLYITVCHQRASLDLIYLLLESCPDAIKVKCTCDETPLHTARSNKAPFDTISLLLRAWPAAVKEKD
eukprot:1389714-Ditylum_brightwellii.AAC.1